MGKVVLAVLAVVVVVVAMLEVVVLVVVCPWLYGESGPDGEVVLKVID